MHNRAKLFYFYNIRALVKVFFVFFINKDGHLVAIVCRKTSARVIYCIIMPLFL